VLFLLIVELIEHSLVFATETNGSRSAAYFANTSQTSLHNCFGFLKMHHVVHAE